MSNDTLPRAEGFDFVDESDAMPHANFDELDRVPRRTLRERLPSEVKFIILLLGAGFLALVASQVGSYLGSL